MVCHNRPGTTMNSEIIHAQETSLIMSSQASFSTTTTEYHSVTSTSSSGAERRRARRTHKSIHLHFRTTLDEEDNSENEGASDQEVDDDSLATVIDFRNMSLQGIGTVSIEQHQQGCQTTNGDKSVFQPSHITAESSLVDVPLRPREANSSGGFNPISFSEENVSVPKDFRKRAVKALKETVPAIIAQELNKEMDTTSSCGCICCCTADQCCNCCKPLPQLVNQPELNLSLEMKAARFNGFKITKSLLIPTLPTFVTILWVIVEFLVTLSQFIFSVVTVNINQNMAFNIVYLSLASLNLILACIDSFLFFISFDRVRNTFKRCCCCFCKRDKNHHVSENHNKEEADNTKKCCGSNWRKSLSQWTELLRNLLSELLLYPLVVCDLFELIDSQTYKFQSDSDKVSFSYFIIGLFFLVASVYVVRTLIVFMTLRSLRKIPLDFTSTGNETVNVITRFLFHVLLQLIVHMLCIIAVAAKILQENGDRVTTGTVYVSPMLWVVLFTGWLIPLMGTFIYFPVNYFWIEQFSIAMYMNLVGLLQETSFAEAVFTKKASEEVKESCEQFFEEIKFVEVKRQIKAREKIGFLYRLLYPLRMPLFYFVTPVYSVILVAFITSLVFSVDEVSGNVNFSLFTQGSAGVAITLCILATILANYQFILIIAILFIAAFTIVGFLVLTLPLALIGAAVVILIPCLPVLIYKTIKRARNNP